MTEDIGEFRDSLVVRAEASGIRGCEICAEPYGIFILQPTRILSKNLQVLLKEAHIKDNKINCHSWTDLANGLLLCPNCHNLFDMPSRDPEDHGRTLSIAPDGKIALHGPVKKFKPTADRYDKFVPWESQIGQNQYPSAAFLAFAFKVRHLNAPNKFAAESDEWKRFEEDILENAKVTEEA